MQVEIEPVKGRKGFTVKNKDLSNNKIPVFSDGEDVRGKIHINLKKSKLEHTGVKVELVGQICI